MKTQSHYFYTSLKTLVTTGDLDSEHPLARCPVDPFQRGTTMEEKQAIASLTDQAGYRWAYTLRRLYYGYVCSGRRRSNLHMGIAFLSMYDEGLVQLLRSHPGDEVLFPSVYLWDEQAEAWHYDMLHSLDSFHNTPPGAEKEHVRQMIADTQERIREHLARAGQVSER